MRTLYRQYYRHERRGFADREFRQVCENVAGCSLSELFDVYASTTQPADYGKYLAYVGLGLEPDFTINPLPNPDLLQRRLLQEWLKDELHPPLPRRKAVNGCRDSPLARSSATFMIPMDPD